MKNKNSNLMLMWDKIFCQNIYGNCEELNGKKYVFPNDYKEVKKDIDEYLDYLYSIKKEYFQVSTKSSLLKKDIDSFVWALYERGLSFEASEIDANKGQTLLDRADFYKCRNYEKYINLVYLLKNSDYPNSFKVMLLREFLLNSYAFEEGKFVVNKRVPGETISGFTTINLDIISQIYCNGINDKIRNVYFDALKNYREKIILSSSLVTNNNMGRWVKFDSKSNDHNNFSLNVNNLKELISDTLWPSKTFLELEESDIYVFVDNNNIPHLLMVLDGNKIVKIDGIDHGYTYGIEDDYYDVILSFLDSNKMIECGKNFVEEINCNKRRVMYSNYIESGEYDKLDFGDITKLIFDGMFICNFDEYKENYLLHRLRGTVFRNRNVLSNKCPDVLISYDDYDAKGNVCPYKYILTNAYFADLVVIEVTNVEYVYEEASFCNNYYVKSLGSLKYVGANLILSYNKDDSYQKRNNYISNIEDLGNLEIIMGNAYLNDSKIRNLGNLKYVGRDLDITNTYVTSLDGIEYIGGKLITDNVNLLKEFHDNFEDGRRVNNISLVKSM